MKLSRFTPAQKFDIKTPIYNGRMVGLATYKVGQHNEINILTKGKDGNRYYPQPLYISGADARKCEVQPVKSNPNVKLYIVPINKMEVLERE